MMVVVAILRAVPHPIPDNTDDGYDDSDDDDDEDDDNDDDDDDIDDDDDDDIDDDDDDDESDRSWCRNPRCRDSGRGRKRHQLHFYEDRKRPSLVGKHQALLHFHFQQLALLSRSLQHGERGWQRRDEESNPERRWSEISGVGAERRQRGGGRREERRRRRRGKARGAGNRCEEEPVEEGEEEEGIDDKGEEKKKKKKGETRSEGVCRWIEERRQQQQQPKKRQHQRRRGERVCCDDANEVEKESELKEGEEKGSRVCVGDFRALLCEKNIIRGSFCSKDVAGRGLVGEDDGEDFRENRSYDDDDDDGQDADDDDDDDISEPVLQEGKDDYDDGDFRSDGGAPRSFGSERINVAPDEDGACHHGCDGALNNNNNNKNNNNKCLGNQVGARNVKDRFEQKTPPRKDASLLSSWPSGGKFS